MGVADFQRRLVADINDRPKPPLVALALCHWCKRPGDETNPLTVWQYGQAHRSCHGDAVDAAEARAEEARARYQAQLKGQIR